MSETESGGGQGGGEGDQGQPGQPDQPGQPSDGYKNDTYSCPRASRHATNAA
jgi:hypothetical protein